MTFISDTRVPTHTDAVVMRPLRRTERHGPPEGAMAENSVKSRHRGTLLRSAASTLTHRIALMLAFIPALSIASATVAQAEGGIQFLDDQPIRIDLSGPSGPKPAVTILNTNTEKPVRVTVEVVGSAAQTISPVRSRGGGASAIAFDGTTLRPQERVTIGFDVRGTTVPGKNRLVATGDDGSIVRLQLLVVGQHPSRAADRSTTGTFRPAIVAGAAESQTLAAHTAVPSLLRPIPKWYRAGAVVLLLALTGAVLAAKTLHRSRAQRPTVALFAATALTALLCLVATAGLFEAALAASRGHSDVAIGPLPVIPQPTTVTQGALTSDRGQLAVLALGPDGLTIKGLERAGTLNGQIDLRPDDDAGDLKVKVNVRDRWFYALIPLGLGVVGGYFVSRYYRLQREQSQARTEAARLWKQIAGDESRWGAHTHGCPWSLAYRMVGLAQSWLREAGQHGYDKPEARKTMAALKEYIAPFERLRDTVNILGEEYLALIQRAEGQGVPVERPGGVLTGTRRLLTTRLDLTHESHDRPLLTEQQKRVDEAKKDLESLKTVVDALFELRDQAGKQQRTDLLDKTTAALAQAFTATKDELANIHNETEALRKELLALPAGPRRAEQFGATPGATEATSPVDVGVARRTEIRQTGAVPMPGEVESNDRDDLLEFQAELSEKDRGNRGYRWSFGDGTMPTRELHPNGHEPTMTVWHQFTGASTSYTVSLHDDRNKLIDSREVALSAGPGRAERWHRRFELDDLAMTVVTGALAVASGYLALYTTEPAWGLPADYTKALLWGVVVSEGAKAVSNLAGRIWPLT